MFIYSSLAVAASIASVSALPAAAPPTQAQLADPNYGPIPGQSSIYSTYTGKAPPFPASNPSPVNATTTGEPGPDDLLFQNLLSAEWAVFSFYQQGVEAFNETSFTDLKYPNTTYERICEIRDNEAGHLRIFQDQISTTSIKPGACQYDYPFGSDPQTFLAVQTLIEVSSMAFLTGLAQEAKLNVSKGALEAIGQVETRHEVRSPTPMQERGEYSLYHR